MFLLAKSHSKNYIVHPVNCSLFLSFVTDSTKASFFHPYHYSTHFEASTTLEQRNCHNMYSFLSGKLELWWKIHKATEVKRVMQWINNPGDILQFEVITTQALACLCETQCNVL